jgi:hypothetical protein
MLQRNQTIATIRQNIGENNVWISVDETTDVKGWYIVNVVVGSMEVEEKSSVHLLTSEQIQKTISSTVAQVFSNALLLLWPEGIQYERVLLFLTDATPYMKKAAAVLKVIYSRMLHVTCLAHALHRVSEYIRDQFPRVDKLVANGK